MLYNPVYMRKNPEIAEIIEIGPAMPLNVAAGGSASMPIAVEPDPSEVVGDVLSDILNLVDARSVVTGGMFAGGAWSLRFRPRGIKFYAVIKGACWMAWEGEEPLRLEVGDLVLMADRRPFLLASDLQIAPVEAREAFASIIEAQERLGNHPESCATARCFATVGDGTELEMLMGHVVLDSDRGDLLLDGFPPVIYLRGASPEATAARQLLGLLASEFHHPRVGNRMASAMLTQLVFLHALRAHLSSSECTKIGQPGWFRALGDGQIGPTLRAMHGEPGRAWTLNDLARIACMSRSAFALRFKEVTGVAPLAYLVRWRMRLAQRELRSGTAPVSELAYSLGYASESAFSNAFKRVVGVAPRYYREAAPAKR